MPRCWSFLFPLLFPLFFQRSSAMTPLGHRWPCWSASATAPRRSCARRAARCRRKTHSGRSCRMTRNRSCDACRRNCGRWGWGWGDGGMGMGMWFDWFDKLKACKDIGVQQRHCQTLGQPHVDPAELRRLISNSTKDKPVWCTLRWFDTSDPGRTHPNNDIS